MSVAPRKLLPALLLALSAVACSSGTSGWSYADPPASELVATGVRRDFLVVPGVTAPKNPITSGTAPAGLESTLVVRYRTDATPAAAPRAILLAMPGYLAGARAFEVLATLLVQKLAAAGMPVEVWAIDRRANNLEDLRGMIAAAEAGSAAAAVDYYFNGLPVGGKLFPGFRRQAQLDYLSEWGLSVHVQDLHAVIAKVPAPMRKGHVFLMGHSLGAFFAEAYAAWRFADGTRGVDELAGLVLLDGALGTTPLTQQQYENSGDGTVITHGLTDLRANTRFATLSLLGVDTLARSEILALRAAQKPAAVEADAARDQLFGSLLGLAKVPPMTNRAALGFAFDRHFSGLVLDTATLGQVVGPSASYQSFLFNTQLLQPTDPNTTYDWNDSPSATPKAFTTIDALARAYGGGRSNFVEWYFPLRLALDLAAVGGAAVPAGSWQSTLYDLHASDGPSDDAPVLSVAGGLFNVAQMAAISSRLSAAVGSGRKAAGALRTTDAGLRVVDGTALSHVDVLTARDIPENPVPGAVTAFVQTNVDDGTVALGF